MNRIPTNNHPRYGCLHQYIYDHRFARFSRVSISHSTQYYIVTKVFRKGAMFKLVDHVSLSHEILCHSVVGGSLCTAAPYPQKKIGEGAIFISTNLVLLKLASRKKVLSHSFTEFCLPCCFLVVIFVLVYLIFS